MIKKSTLATRQGFAKAVENDIPKSEVLRELGIGLSTYYQWKKLLSERGINWIDGIQTTRAIRAKEMSVKATHDLIVMQSLLNPTLGANKLAKLLEQDFEIKSISSSTVGSVLLKAGVGKRNQRASMLHQRYLQGKTLTDSQLRLIETIDPLVFSKVAKGNYFGEVLSEDVLRFHHSSPFGTAPPGIIVDTFSGIAFSCFPKVSLDNLATECLQLGIKEFSDRGGKFKSMYIDNGWEFGRGKNKSNSQFIHALKANKIKCLYMNLPQNRQNPFVIDVWHELRNFLCNGGISEPEQYRHSLFKLNPIIKEHLDKNYNS